MARLIFLILLGCGSDIAIITKQQTQDTSVVDQQPAAEPGIEPSTEPASEPGSEMTDLTIGFANIHFRQIACPACVGESGEFDITAELKLHYPTSGDYTEHLTPVGTCTTNVFNNYVSMQPLPSTQPASFNGITLNPSGQGIWSNNYIYEYQYERNTSYTITSEHGTIPSAFTTMEGFDSMEPYTMLWVDPSYAFDAIISKSGTYFSWYPSVPNSQFEIMIAVYTPDGSQLLGMVSCMEQDVGSMLVPGTYFQTYPTWSLAAIHLSRHRVDRIPVIELNGYLQSHMQWEVVGTAHVE